MDYLDRTLPQLQAIASTSVHHGDELIYALEAARDARSLIKSAQASLLIARDRAENEIERAAREYQIDLVEWQLNRAADVAEKRLAHLAKIRTQADVTEELEKCSNDKAYWFEHYAWGFDPRADSPLNVMPFALFPFQVPVIEWLDDITFERRTSGVCEKPREVGATDMVRGWLLHNWLFYEGFSALLTSRTQDEVDKAGDPKTLFERLRFQLRLLPLWMLPVSFEWNNDATYMKLLNRATDANIIGSAPVVNIGRGGRYTVAYVDEGAFLQNGVGGFAQHTALSLAAKTQVWVSSVCGKFNKFAHLAHDGRTPKLTIDWREHPWKDQRWYDALPYGYFGSAMTAEQIAQEIDCNYEASQPGKVFKQWREEYVLITWEELIAYYDQFGLGHKFIDPHTGQYRIPDEFTWGRMQDYGQTEGHPWIVSHMARPPESFPLHDSVFIFSMHRVTPTGASPAEGREQYRRIEAEFGLLSSKGEYAVEPELSEMSHEALELRQTLFDEYGDYWNAWQTDYNLGVPQVQQWLDLIEPTLPNPIRPALNGRARMYCVAHESEYRFVFDKKNQRYFVTPSATDKGFKLFREEMPAYHYPPEEMGKPVHKMRPQKIKDDGIDTVRGFATKWGPSVKPMSKQERRISKLPAHLKPREVKAKIGTPEFVEAHWAQQHALGQIRQQEEVEEKLNAAEWAKIAGRPAQHRKYRR